MAIGLAVPAIASANPYIALGDSVTALPGNYAGLLYPDFQTDLGADEFLNEAVPGATSESIRTGPQLTDALAGINAAFDTKVVTAGIGGGDALFGTCDSTSRCRPNATSGRISRSSSGSSGRPWRMIQVTQGHAAIAEAFRDAKREAVTDCHPDTTRPATTITKGPKKVGKRAVKLVFRSSEKGSTFKCSLDGKRFSTCRSPKTLKGLKKGKHSFRVRATDAAGNVDTTPAKRKFRIKR